MASAISASLFIYHHGKPRAGQLHLFGYTVVWLPLYQRRFQSVWPSPLNMQLCGFQGINSIFRRSVCVASSAPACGSHSVWRQLYQLVFSVSACVVSVVSGSFSISPFMIAVESAIFSGISIMCAFSYSRSSSGCQHLWLQLHQLTFGLLLSAVAASLLDFNVCGFTYIDQPHFGLSACVASAISASPLQVRLCGSKRISFTLVMSSTFSYHPLQNQACQLHVRLSACVASAVSSSLSDYQPW